MNVWLACSDERHRDELRQGLLADEIQLVDSLDQGSAEVIVIDTHGSSNAAKMAADCRNTHPGSRVIVLGDDSGDEFLFALEAGAAGFLPITIDPVALARTVRAVRLGEVAIPRALVARLAASFTTRRGHVMIHRGSDGRLVDLTEREWTVLCLLGEGLSTRHIAERLYMSQPTVRSHVASVLHKLGVPSREAAIGVMFPQTND